MRIQRRDGGSTHHGHRQKKRGGYTLTCKRDRLVPFSVFKRTKRAIDCPICMEYLAFKRSEKQIGGDSG
jgi:hypothetical protein